MPPKKQKGGLIDPMSTLNVIKASDVRMLSSPEIKYNSANYVNIGGSNKMKNQSTTSNSTVSSNNPAKKNNEKKLQGKKNYKK